MGKIVVHRPGEEFNEHFGMRPAEKQIETWVNVWWRVFVCRDLAPRESRFDYEREMGSSLIEAVLFHRQCEGLKAEHLTFVFPERHMEQAEQQSFPSLLWMHPQIVARKMTIVDMYTNSPTMVSNFVKEDIRILSHERGELNRRKMNELLKDLMQHREKLFKLHFSEGAT